MGQDRRTRREEEEEVDNHMGQDRKTQQEEGEEVHNHSKPWEKTEGHNGKKEKTHEVLGATNGTLDDIKQQTIISMLGYANLTILRLICTNLRLFLCIYLSQIFI